MSQVTPDDRPRRISGVIVKRALQALMLASLVALAACQDKTLSDIAPKANAKLPARIVQQMKAKGMNEKSPIMVRIFKEEAKLEVWKQKTNGRYDIIASYDICKWSGKLGPKFKEGDRQAPEGFYTVGPSSLNPNSSYHLSFNMGFPNAYDRVNNRTGMHLMVHGGCSSSGCYSMTDEQVTEIYAFARDAFSGGQRNFQIQAFPFRMTPANMARYKDDPNIEFWKMLKEGYDHFEITKVPPKVDVCDKKYVFNQMTLDGQPISPTSACPVMTQPDSLKLAYQSYKNNYESAFDKALGGKITRPAPSIQGLAEVDLVVDWTKRRARGEAVTREPPSLSPEGAVLAPQDNAIVRIANPDGTRRADPAPQNRTRFSPAQQAITTPSASAPAPAARPANIAPAVTPTPVPADVPSAAAPSAEVPIMAAQPEQEKTGFGQRFRGLFTR
ncbi:L,D-transpeptidase family protein [Limoniibacter endophyticus]